MPNPKEIAKKLSKAQKHALQAAVDDRVYYSYSYDRWLTKEPYRNINRSISVLQKLSLVARVRSCHMIATDLGRAVLAELNKPATPQIVDRELSKAEAAQNITNADDRHDEEIKN